MLSNFKHNYLFRANNISVFLIIISFFVLFLKSNLSSISLILLFLFSQINFFWIEKKQLKDLKGLTSFKNYYIYLMTYFFVILLSVIYSDDKSTALKYTTRHTAFLFIPVSFYCLPELNKWRQYRIRKAYVYWVALVLIFLLINAIFQNHLKGYSLIDFFLIKLQNLIGLSNEKVIIEYWLFTYEGLTQIIDIQPIYLNLLVNVAFVFLLKLKDSNQINIKLFWFFCFYYLFFVLLLSSRSGLAIFILLFVCYMFFVKSKSKKELLNSVIVTFVFFSLTLGFIFTNPILKYRVMSIFNVNLVHNHLNFSNQSIRLIKWENAFEEIKESPFIGHGIGDYKNKLLQRYETNEFLLGIVNKYNAHNQYLDTTLQIGILGLIVLLVIFYHGMFSKHSKGFEIKFIFLIFLLSFITESMFGRHFGIVSFVLFVCFLFKTDNSMIIPPKLGQ